MSKVYDEHYKKSFGLKTGGCIIHKRYAHVCVYFFNPSVYIPFIYKTKKVKSTIYFKNSKQQILKKVWIN
jgi:hypothetical protein